MDEFRHRCQYTLGVELDMRELAAALAVFATATLTWREAPLDTNVRFDAALKRLLDVAEAIRDRKIGP